MRKRSNQVWRRIVFAVIAMVSLVTGEVALAQSNNCAQLARTLNSLSNNRDFRSLKNNVNAARQLASDLRDMESLFVRGGCQRQLKQEGRVTGNCRALARRIVNGRNDYNKLSASVETGQAVAQQREQMLQQVARFRCNTRSNSRVEVRTRSNNPFENLLDRLFGNDVFIDDNDYYYGGQSTLRTVCVRTCDGYYWPVSFSTVGQFLGEDSARCEAQCPGSEVALYYYNNPGETPDDMVDLNGNPYRSLPTAFQYRTQYDKACTCKKQIEYGGVVVEASASGAEEGRKIVQFEEVSFPLPIPDPRERTQEVVVAELIHVPLPVPRPVRPGEKAPQRVVPQVVAQEIREAVVGGKTVRIVGPDTPYAQSKAAGT